MSLINKVLTDLESRTDGTSAAHAPQRVYDGLRPAAMARPKRPYRAVIVGLLVMAAAGAGAFIGMQFWSKAPVALDTPPVTATIPSLPPVVPLQSGETPVKPIAAPVAGSSPEIGARPSTTTPQIESQAPTVVVATASGAPHVAAPEAKPPARAARAPGAKAVHAEPVLHPVRRPHSIPRTERAAGVAEREEVRSTADVAKKPVPMTAQEQAENDYRAAVRAWQQRDVTGAEAKLKAALTVQADHSKARELLAAVLISQGRAGAAQTLLEQGLTATPTHYPYALLLARLYVNQGAEAKAIGVLERVRASAQRDPEYLGFLAALYQRAGRYDDAIGAYRAALAQRPQEGRWWMGLGICLEGAKNSTAAVEAYARAREGAGMTPALIQYVEQRLAVLKPSRE